MLYFYKCKSIRVIDGDTAELEVSLGLHCYVRRIARLLGINAPEIHGETLPAGEQAKRRLVELIDSAGDELCCRTHLDRNEKFGRLLVELFPSADSPLSFNEMLLSEGLAVRM